MQAQPRRPASGIGCADIPTAPGVYAWFRDGSPIYASRAVATGGLQRRLWRNYPATGLDLSHSSFRRNVCEHVLGTRTALSRQRPSVLAQTHVDEVGVEYLDQLLDLTGADYMGLESLDLRELEIEIDRCFLGTHLEERDLRWTESLVSSLRARSSADDADGPGIPRRAADHRYRFGDAALAWTTRERARRSSPVPGDAMTSPMKRSGGGGAMPSAVDVPRQ